MLSTHLSVASPGPRRLSSDTLCVLRPLATKERIDEPRRILLLARHCPSYFASSSSLNRTSRLITRRSPPSPIWSAVVSTARVSHPEAPPQFLPSRRRWHRSTFVFLAFVVAVLVLANFPGQLVIGPDVFSIDQYGSYFLCDAHCEHGWPFTYMRRKPSVFSGPCYWNVFEGVERFSAPHLIADIAVALAIVLSTTFLFGLWRRQRRRLRQFHVRDLLVLAGSVSLAGAMYGHYRSEHADQWNVLKAVERMSDPNDPLLAWGATITRHAEWQPGGPSWVRQLVGDSPFQPFDRVIGVDVSGAELRHIANLRSLRVIRVHESVSNRQLQYLAGLPQLEALSIGLINFDDEGHETVDENGHVTDGCLQLPKLPNLRGLNLYQGAFCGDGLENIPAIESLDVTGTQMTDHSARKLAKLIHLRSLSLAGTEITDDGLRHISSLHNLEQLWLGNMEVGNGGLAHLSNLQQLRWLELEGNDITDAAIPSLKRFARLEYLDLGGTAVSPSGRRELRMALPNCYIP